MMWCLWLLAGVVLGVVGLLAWALMSLTSDLSRDEEKHNVR